MSTFNEKEFVLDVQSFFNEEDYSVGLYPIGSIDADIVEDFKESFGVEILSYNKYEIEFKVNGDTYVVRLSSSYERWVVYRHINLV